MGFLLWLAGFGEVAPAESPGEDSSTYLYHHWYEELGLFGGSVLFTFIVLVVLIGVTYAGQFLGGHNGRLVGFDIGLGLLAFAGSGGLIHIIRYYIIRIYLRIALGTWSRDEALNHGPKPGKTLRRFIVSTDWDFVAQFIIAIVTVGIALLVAS